MADEKPGEGSASPEPIYAESNLPVAYVDTVSSLSFTGETVKFYLARFDPSINSVGTNKTQVVAQVIMPISGFASATIFLQHMLGVIRERGAISDEQMQKIEDLFEPPPTDDGNGGD